MNSQFSSIPIPVGTWYSQLNRDIRQEEKRKLNNQELDAASVLCILNQSEKKDVASSKKKIIYKPFSLSGNLSKKKLNKYKFYNIILDKLAAGKSVTEIAISLCITPDKVSQIKYTYKRTDRKITRGWTSCQDKKLAELYETGKHDLNNLADKFNKNVAAIKSRIFTLKKRGLISKHINLS